ncbi:hypothetical protein M3Y97_00043000 [Aphelenchoides bicaudatus]|nr:hypothetical protein M3Y97_00043000 [Aphelenchoides bicaudatus]
MTDIGSSDDSSADENSIEEQEKEDEISGDALTAVSKEQKRGNRKRQFYLYESKKSFYRQCLSELDNEHICGLIICVHDGICYILTNGRYFVYKPEQPCDTTLVGCWLRFKLNSDDQMTSSTPGYSEPPIHTRVFESNKIPYLLIYECVEVFPREVRSKFLGRIQNTLDLKSKKGQPWKYCNVEYTIRCSFDGTMFKYETNVVKHHGSVLLHTNLPQMLSFITHNGDRSDYKRELFEDAFYSLEEQKVRTEKRIQNRQNNNLEKSRAQMDILFPVQKANLIEEKSS